MLYYNKNMSRSGSSMDVVNSRQNVWPIRVHNWKWKIPCHIRENFEMKQLHFIIAIHCMEVVGQVQILIYYIEQYQISSAKSTSAMLFEKQKLIGWTKNGYKINVPINSPTWRPIIIERVPRFHFMWSRLIILNNYLD